MVIFDTWLLTYDLTASPSLRQLCVRKDIRRICVSRAKFGETGVNLRSRERSLWHSRSILHVPPYCITCSVESTRSCLAGFPLLRRPGSRSSQGSCALYAPLTCVQEFIRHPGHRRLALNPSGTHGKPHGPRHPKIDSSPQFDTKATGSSACGKHIEARAQLALKRTNESLAPALTNTFRLVGCSHQPDSTKACSI
jgi:hypothetical protein